MSTYYYNENGITRSITLSIKEYSEEAKTKTLYDTEKEAKKHK